MLKAVTLTGSSATLRTRETLYSDTLREHLVQRLQGKIKSFKGTKSTKLEAEKILRERIRDVGSAHLI